MRSFDNSKGSRPLKLKFLRVIFQRRQHFRVSPMNQKFVIEIQVGGKHQLFRWRSDYNLTADPHVHIPTKLIEQNASKRV